VILPAQNNLSDETYSCFSSDPKVNIPIKLTLGVVAGLKNNVAVAFVELSVGNFLDLVGQKILNFPNGQTNTLSGIVIEEL
jgi:hypothetical protein